MSATQDRRAALRALMGRQTRLLTNQLRYEKTSRECPVCEHRYWYPTDDPSICEPPLQTSCCRKVIGADCLRLFLTPYSEGGGNSSSCPSCGIRLLDTRGLDQEQTSTNLDDFQTRVRTFQDVRKRQVRSFRKERARADCALYEEIHDEGRELPGPLGDGGIFGGNVEPAQRTQGLDYHQYNALFFELQREGAFKPIDSAGACELPDTELYKNLRKARTFYCLRRARWEDVEGQPVFINRVGGIGSVEQLAKDEEGKRPPSWIMSYPLRSSRRISQPSPLSGTFQSSPSSGSKRRGLKDFVGVKGNLF